MTHESPPTLSVSAIAGLVPSSPFPLLPIEKSIPTECDELCSADNESREPEASLGKRTCDGTSAPPAKKRKATEVKLPKLLQPLKKEQMEQMILDLVAAQPELEKLVRQHLPTFDVTGAINELKSLSKKMFRAFPNSRFGSSYDHSAYERVAPVQAAFIKATKEPLMPLATSKQWQALLEYLLGAIVECDDLPNWNSPADQKPKIMVFKALAAAMKKLLKQKTYEIHVMERQRLQSVCEEYNTSANGCAFAECLALLAAPETDGAVPALLIDEHE